MTLDVISDHDRSYTPPLGSPWDAVQTAGQAWVRQHQLDGQRQTLTTHVSAPPTSHPNAQRCIALPHTTSNFGHRRPSVVLKEAINVKHHRPGAAISLLAAGALVLSACTHTIPPNAGGARVECGGKQALTASGSSAQANAMTRFISAYRTACPGQTLNYTSNGSGAGIS
ncbi:MAG TPA: substrate-binding domain-containing protein, partial [Mycobacterium sp.]|nr:substrate-binding domain-containing protein [Mycobacterium sp.]